jgi:DNA-directed RNA polymerase specialized sigma24 family protein
MAQSHLRNVARAAARLEAAREDLARAILAAQTSGESLRDIAPYAGVSYTRVHQIVREARQREAEEG